MEQPNDEKTANGTDLNGGEISVPFVHEQLVGIEFPSAPPRRPEIKVHFQKSCPSDPITNSKTMNPTFSWIIKPIRCFLVA